MLTTKDTIQLRQLGISEDQVSKQLDNFAKGFPYLSIISPAVVGRGITVVNAAQQQTLIALYDSFGGSKVKFVPASGAATRMFKQLFEYKDADDKFDLNDRKNEAIKSFFDNLQRFAFFDLLKETLAKRGVDAENLRKEQYVEVARALLDDDGLAYCKLPKAVLMFHKYPHESRTAIEEHLVEVAMYARSGATATLHFTVSPEHRERVSTLLKSVKLAYEQRFGLTYSISFSEQKKSTDTIAVDMNNDPFRESDGSLLFRPGGHGALLDNLNELDEDLVFIKNIDNVVPETKLDETIRWKKVLAGVLLSSREKVFAYLRKLESREFDSCVLKEISDFLQDTFSVTIPDSIPIEEYVSFLYDKLNRPIRVCGMVKNEGEPGGGPFIISESDDSTSLQILEASQINPQDAHMKACLDASTHFNPVDLVCSYRNYKGGKYDLRKLVDPQTGFISEKSKDGKPLKAQELPGLWNGAMSRWNTIFVEVPLSTFNPVKTVNDLLRKEHQV